jgi:Family of unknown function (DUF6599)
MKRILVFLFLIATAAAYAQSHSTALVRVNVLPKVFAGWQLASENVSTDPVQADPVYTDLLKEDGFNLAETAEYTKPDRKMTVKAARFGDATGAYAAYTFYRTPEMAKEDIGDQSASNGTHILFRKGNLLVDVKLDKVMPMTAGDLRELASDLPQPVGNDATPPNIASYLPTAGMAENTVKYAAGPIGLARINSPLPASLVDFSGTKAELVTADYNTGEGAAKLTILAYPEPAVAGKQLREIEAWHPAAAPGAQAPAIYAKRTGRLVAVITGNISEGEAKTLLASVNYDPQVTWNENTHFDRNSNLGSLLVNIIILIAVILGLSLVAGVAFGGVRILLKKIFPDRVFDRSEDIDIIRLNIGK